MSPTPSFDVLGIGIVTVDEMLYVERYPEPESKVPVLRRVRQCGGLTGTALVAASRLGASCRYAGVLGDDPESDFVRETLLREGIDLRDLDPRRKARPIRSTIVVDESARTRTILFEKDPFDYDSPDWPPAGTVLQARVLFLDHDFAERGLRAARIAREAGIPIVADYERDDPPQFAELLATTDHLILSHAFAARITGQSDPSAAARALWAPGRSAVVVTCGADGCRWIDRSCPESPGHQPAFPVAVADTTGCGDVFHGAYAAALARGLPLPERLRLASAAAAIKATRLGGQEGIPTLDEANRFLAESGR
jgi:ribokinase